MPVDDLPYFDGKWEPDEQANDAPGESFEAVRAKVKAYRQARMRLYTEP